MGKLYDTLMKDYRLREGLNACINCGTCTAVCPAAEFYRYDPRRIVDIVQSGDDEKIEELLKGDTIWYCGECMSCLTRCPRKNAPGLVIMALRSLSIDLGYFIESEKAASNISFRGISAAMSSTTDTASIPANSTTNPIPRPERSGSGKSSISKRCMNGSGRTSKAAAPAPLGRFPTKTSHS